jgi:putative SOS response-associated peptidase YedK
LEVSIQYGRVGLRGLPAQIKGLQPGNVSIQYGRVGLRGIPGLDDEGLREMAIARWGLVPLWAKELPKHQPINARAETVPTGGMFRQAFARRRCLVPADGFYEWQGAKPPKQPYFIHQPDDGQFAFAGLWERWRETKDADPVDTFTIITTTPNELMATIHNRMPVILKPDDYAAWLDGSTPPDRLKSLLAPYPDEWEAYPVSTHVNNPKNDDPECVEKLKSIRDISA